MSAHDKLVWVGVVSNALLWGGIGLGFLWLILTDPTIPNEEPKATIVSQGDEATQDAAPRHRA